MTCFQWYQIIYYVMLYFIYDVIRYNVNWHRLVLWLAGSPAGKVWFGRKLKNHWFNMLEQLSDCHMSSGRNLKDSQFGIDVGYCIHHTIDSALPLSNGRNWTPFSWRRWDLHGHRKYIHVPCKLIRVIFTCTTICFQ